MPLSSEAQALFDHARQSVPRWLTGAASAALEWLYGFTEIFDAVRVQGLAWIGLTYLDNAVGAELDQHARDRGTTRRIDEDDGVLRERLRQITDAVTERALIHGIDAIIEPTNLHLAIFNVASWVSTGWNSVFQAYDTMSAGGSQTGISLETISDGTHPPTINHVYAGSTPHGGSATITITIHYWAGVTTRADIESLVDGSSGAIYTLEADPSGATVLSASDEFTSHNFVLSAMVCLRRDRGHYHTHDPLIRNCTAFLGRGYRMGQEGRPMVYIVILPYPATEATANAIAEYLRQYGPGGYQYYVERRLTP